MVGKIIFILFVAVTFTFGKPKSHNFKKEMEHLQQELVFIKLNLIDINKTMEDKKWKKIALVQQKEIDNLTSDVKAINEELHFTQSHISKVDDMTQNKVGKNEVSNIVDTLFLKKISIIQTEYRNAILGTNNNLTTFGWILTIIGFLIAFASALFGYKLSNDLKIFKKEVKRDVQKRIRKNTITSLKYAVRDINKIHYYQNSLFYNNNKKFTTDIAKISADNFKEYSEIHSKYNGYYQKISDITSLDKDIMITTLKELAAPSFYPLVNMVSMGEYLEYLYGYDNDEELRKAIRDIQSRIKT